MELFFDLVFVVFVGQLAHGIHGNPGWLEFGTFILLFFPAWWAWVNMVSIINFLHDLPPGHSDVAGIMQTMPFLLLLVTAHVELHGRIGRREAASAPPA